jgi:anti-sigma factor ChrR (cupin superfamily)
VISLPFNSVCLEHGKPEPTPSSRYKLVPVEQVSQDPVLYELLTVVGTGKVDSQAAQAAAWHLTDKMSFQQLAAKAMTHLGGLPPTPYFSQAQLQGAQQLLALSTQKAEERKDKKPAVEQPKTTRVSEAK